MIERSGLRRKKMVRKKNEPKKIEENGRRG